ncbi:hypothetical protein ABVT39_026549 [Epinephelus coioides]
MRPLCLQREEATQRSTLEIGLGLGTEVCGLAGDGTHMTVKYIQDFGGTDYIFDEISYQTSSEKATTDIQKPQQAEVTVMLCH